MEKTDSNSLMPHSRPKPSDINKTHQEKLGLLDRLGVVITRSVGTMVAAIVFTILSLISLPAALATHDKIIIVAWIAQTFLQLVLLPIIIVGQNIQGKHTEVMADEEFKTTQTTYKDLEHLITVNKQQLDILIKLSEKNNQA
jgi:uncharacterized membrane protein